MDCYSALKDMQGKSIPILRSSGCNLAKNFPSRPFGMVVSWVGGITSQDTYKTLPEDALVKLRQVAIKMHQRGVVHNDLRASNVKYDARTGKLWVFDFSHAATRATAGDAWFKTLCKEELWFLDLEIQHARSKLDVEFNHHA